MSGLNSYKNGVNDNHKGDEHFKSAAFGKLHAGLADCGVHGGCVDWSILAACATVVEVTAKLVVTLWFCKFFISPFWTWQNSLTAH